MHRTEGNIRVLYSFPHKLGAGRICYTAWEQVQGVARAGAEVLAMPGVLHRPVLEGVRVQPTIARGRFRIPYKLLGAMRACALHDYVVSRRLERLAGQVDVVHVWPLGSRLTLKTAARLGIPTVLERPNAHTAFAYEVVRKECDRLGIVLPADYEHAFNAQALQREEEEYATAFRILCPSEFTARTFLDKGFAPERLARHIYGYDPQRFYPANQPRHSGLGLNVLFAGLCAVRKGLHFALEAWLRSEASRHGTFSIAGDFLPAYKSRLSAMLAHPSVRVLGQRGDIPELMRRSDIFVLPSIEEGFGLVVAEAIGSGCVPLASDACTEVCSHMQNGLVHHAGDIAMLAEQFALLHKDRSLLSRLRSAALAMRSSITWDAAGVRLLEVYNRTVADFALTMPATDVISVAVDVG